jgi:hypothetical protein
MKARLSTLVALFLFVGTPAVGSNLIYFNDFESNSTAGFSGSTTLTQAPSGANFLGPISNGAMATLILNGIGRYPSINLSFDAASEIKAIPHIVSIYVSWGFSVAFDCETTRNLFASCEIQPAPHCDAWQAR